MKYSTEHKIRLAILPQHNTTSKFRTRTKHQTPNIRQIILTIIVSNNHTNKHNKKQCIQTHTVGSRYNTAVNKEVSSLRSIKEAIVFGIGRKCSSLLWKLVCHATMAERGKEEREGRKNQEEGEDHKDAWRRSTHHPFVRKIEMVRNFI